jgi:hypothetical protein
MTQVTADSGIFDPNPKRTTSDSDRAQQHIVHPVEI